MCIVVTASCMFCYRTKLCVTRLGRSCQLCDTPSIVLLQSRVMFLHRPEPCWCHGHCQWCTCLSAASCGQTSVLQDCKDNIHLYNHLNPVTQQWVTSSTAPVELKGMAPSDRTILSASQAASRRPMTLSSATHSHHSMLYADGGRQCSVQASV